MPVLFKFRSSVGFDAVDLGGRPSISVRGLRARVVERKNLQICADSRLVVFDACTGEAYEDEEFMIPDGSSVIIKRVPAAPGNGAAAGIDHAAAKEDFLGALVSFPSEHVAMDNFDDFGNDLLPAVGGLLQDSDSDSDDRSINSLKRRKPNDCQRWSTFLSLQWRSPGRSWKTFLISGMILYRRNRCLAVSCTSNRILRTTVSRISILRSTQRCSMLPSWPS